MDLHKLYMLFKESYKSVFFLGLVLGLFVFVYVAIGV